jgi:hypothetical protein
VVAPDNTAVGDGPALVMSTLLAVSFASVMVAVGWLLFPAFGWWAVLLPLAITALVAVAWARRRRAGAGVFSAGSAQKFLSLGALVLVMSVFAALIAVLTDASVPTPLLVLLGLASVCMLGAGLAGRSAAQR